MQDGPKFLTDSDISVLTTTKREAYGSVGQAIDGSRYRYVQFGGTSTIASGQLVVAPAVTAAYQGLVIPAAGASGQVTANLATGATQIVVTNGATTITQDQFAEGYLEVLVGAAGVTSSYKYRIRGNTADATGSLPVTVFLYEPLRNVTSLVAGTDTVNLNVALQAGVNISATANIPQGFTIMPVPNTATVTNYGWVLTNGPVDAKNDAAGTVAVGTAVGQSVSVAGAIRTATASTSPSIGQSRVAINASTAGPIFVNVN